MRVGCVGPEQVFRRTEKNTGVILRQPSSLARSSCRRAVVVLVVMLVVVLLLSVVPSCRCCHRRRCHRRPTNAQRPSPSPRPPPSPLPSQSHSLQLSPPHLPCCRFHRRRRRHSHCPRQPHRHTNYLNEDIAGCCHRCGHRRCRCRCRCIRCSHHCRHRCHVSPSPQPPSETTQFSGALQKIPG